MNPTKVMIGSGGNYKLVNAQGITVGAHMVRPVTATQQTAQSNTLSLGKEVRKDLALQLGLTGAGSSQSNPLSDVPNWGTGGRDTSDAAGGDDPSMTWMYVGAAVVLYLVLSKKRKK